MSVRSPKALNSIVGHEVTHALEGTEFYEALKDTVIDLAKTTGEYDSHIAALRQIYSGKEGYTTDFENKVTRELVADLIGDYVFNDTDFIQNLSVKNRNLFQKVYDEIKYLSKVATAGSKEARALEKVKKRFEEAYRTTKNTAQEDGVKYSLSQYSDAQKNNWAKSNKILIYENDVQLMEFIRESVANKEYTKKMYFGAITGTLAERIKKDANLDFEGKNAVLRSNNVRKILKDHGNVEKENRRGQIAVTETDFLAIKDIFGEPDVVKNEPKGYDGKPAATFEKVIGSKKYTMFVVDSGGSLDIFVQTMYIHKQKGSIANVANAKALTITSETPVGTAPSNIVSQKNNEVNTQLSLSDDVGENVPAGGISGKDVALQEKTEANPNTPQYTEGEKKLFAIVDAIRNGTDPKAVLEAVTTEQSADIRTVKERNDAKRQNYEKELLNNVLIQRT